MIRKLHFKYIEKENVIQKEKFIFLELNFYTRKQVTFFNLFTEDGKNQTHRDGEENESKHKIKKRIY